MPKARAKKLAIWARVTESEGQNRSGLRLQPAVMPEATSASMLAAWASPRSTSVKPDDATGTRSNALWMNVAICARLTTLSGQYLRGSRPQPVVTPNSISLSTKGAHHAS